MPKVFKEDLNYEQKDFSQSRLPEGEYLECNFRNCNFSGSDLSASTFVECVFEDCDLGMARITGSAFNDTRFISCKLLGLRFDTIRDLGLQFNMENCLIDQAIFSGLRAHNSHFESCSFRECDFSDSDLQGSVFSNCDLSGAVFDQSSLVECDFRSAVNYSLDPEKNRLRKAKFSVQGIRGLLDKYDFDID